MIDLFQDRRVFVNQKRKQFQKSTLPDIKYHLSLVKKNTQKLATKPDNLTQSGNIMVFNSYQPLSNLLISKKIYPSNNPQTASKKNLQKSIRQTTNRVKRQSLKRIVHVQEDLGQSANSQMNTLDESGIGKRNSSSLSYRIRTKDKYGERIFIENLSTGIQQLPLRTKYRQQPHCYYFLIPKANNNEDLIRQLLLSRKIWRQVKPGQQVPNLKWVFSKQRYNYKKMFSYTQKKMINHFQFNEEISTKDNLVKNLQIYCQTKKMQVFNITPITFIIDFDDEYCQYNIKQFLAFFVKHDPRKNNVNNINNSHMNNSRKSLNSINNFIAKFQPFMSWQNSDIKKKVNILSRPVNYPSYYSENSYLWLLKPTGLNRGRGIQIFDSLQTLQKMLMDFLDHMQRKRFNQTNNRQYESPKKKDKKDKDKQKEKQKTRAQSPSKQPTQSLSRIKILESSICLSSQNKDKQPSTQQPTEQIPIKACRQKFKLNTCSFVIQKYIQKPFLIQGRKFDIRVWALLTHKMQLFFCKEGYIRTSTEVYSTNNIGNYFIHLTNNAIQKNSQNYGQFQSGNQLSFRQLNKYMPEQKVIQIWQKIKQITYMSFSSVKRKINFYQRRNCFELFGLDYFISHDQKVWLIEVNENPCIECSSDLLGKLIPRMLNDALKLTVDQIMDKKPAQDKGYKVDGYADGQSLWQKLGGLNPNQDYQGLKKLGYRGNSQGCPLISP